MFRFDIIKEYVLLSRH